ncbi:hypothetical protein OZX58_03185 [Lactobacillus sp. ESL0680]|uniref:hypothetical protein n=1 Tax=Lactobacillus sp. ESL0680 TaxID=2983210 RepID=UPI0023F97599|nr:hypothetical protein [Lactobacillus sp. ESL0680]WEV39254.1 hypothetical protein OZX58_03185 [Lactobacillus sp. ESL0680]
MAAFTNIYLKTEYQGRLTVQGSVDSILKEIERSKTGFIKVTHNGTNYEWIAIDTIGKMENLHN